MHTYIYIRTYISANKHTHEGEPKAIRASQDEDSARERSARIPPQQRQEAGKRSKKGSARIAGVVGASRRAAGEGHGRLAAATKCGIGAGGRGSPGGTGVTEGGKEVRLSKRENGKEMKFEL